MRSLDAAASQKKAGFSDPSSEERNGAEVGSVVSSATTVHISKGFGGRSGVLNGEAKGGSVLEPN